MFFDLNVIFVTICRTFILCEPCLREMSENKTSCKRTNKNEFEKLAETRRRCLRVWDQFGTTLNSLGPLKQDGKEWHKVWLDCKLKIKRKLLMNKAEVVWVNTPKFPPLEQAVD
ncbi:uncharacterized protein LOC129953666 [Eupeodes corollae]|uniref:uncharacterized protein LOC129953666 n=1 Tax=Eupeodes corollae TaxID=290404 RepID=UPI002493299F|nr:uncharacterized protein LOC129953666 [Eupeodes corollae]